MSYTNNYRAVRASVASFAMPIHIVAAYPTHQTVLHASWNLLSVDGAMQTERKVTIGENFFLREACRHMLQSRLLIAACSAVRLLLFPHTQVFEFRVDRGKRHVVKQFLDIPVQSICGKYLPQGSSRFDDSSSGDKYLCFAACACAQFVILYLVEPQISVSAPTECRKRISAVPLNLLLPLGCSLLRLQSLKEHRRLSSHSGVADGVHQRANANHLRRVDVV